MAATALLAAATHSGGAQSAPTPGRSVVGFDHLLAQLRVAASNDGVPSPAVSLDTEPGWVGILRSSGSPARSWVFQQDATLRRPLGDSGTQVLLVNARTRATSIARIAARRRVIGRGDESCGGPELDGALSGWGYAVDSDPQTRDGSIADLGAWFVLPSSARVSPEKRVPASVARAARDSLIAAARLRLERSRRQASDTYNKLRKLLFSADRRLSRGNEFDVHPVRMRATTVYAVGMRLNDDPGDHGLETTWTLILDRSGRRLGRLDGVRPRLVLDADGDGVDELLTDNALSFFDGAKWVRVVGWTGPGMC